MQCVGSCQYHFTPISSGGVEGQVRGNGKVLVLELEEMDPDMAVEGSSSCQYNVVKVLPIPASASF